MDKRNKQDVLEEIKTFVARENFLNYGATPSNTHILDKAMEFSARLSNGHHFRDLITGFFWGYKDAEKDLGWHSVEESLPEIDEEVVVLIPYCRAMAAEIQYQIISARLVQPIQCMHTDEKIWNIPGVKYWMPMPKIPEKK